MANHPYVLDTSLLEAFNQTVSDNDDFLINKYSNYKGKNIWNLLCSAKDWMHVSTNGLPYINLQHKNDDARSLNVLQLIITFDLVVQSIMQLYRAFEEDYPFKKDNSVFQSSVSDDVYFKQIRACFAAHPVNLDSKDGEKNGEKYFASWSSDVGGKGDYQVYLYSNMPGESATSFMLYFVELHNYVSKRYSLLTILINTIEKKKQRFEEEQIRIDIQREKQPIKQLLILQRENKVRIGESGGYKFEIETLISLFSAPQSFPEGEKDIYKIYLNSLKQVIEDIYQNLQNMKCEELPNGLLLHPNIHHYKVFYDISKVFEFFHNPRNSSSLFEYHLKRLISVGLLPAFANSNMDKRDLQLILLAGLVNNHDN